MRDDIGDLSDFDDDYDGCTYSDMESEDVMEKIINLIQREHGCGLVEAFELYEKMTYSEIKDMLDDYDMSLERTRGLI